MKKILLSCLVLSSVLLGCGGNDPLNVFGTDVLPPVMQLPAAINGNVAVSYQPSVGRNGILIGVQTSTGLVAPVQGLVTAIDIVVTGGAGSYAVTIAYNARFSVRVTDMAATTRRVGDYVTQGSTLGVAGTNNVGIQVLQDGAAICPYSFFTSTDRNSLNTAFTNSAVQPCLI